VGSRLRCVAGVTLALGLRHAANAGRSAVFTGAATFRRQSAGADQAGLQPRADTDEVSASARRFLFAKMAVIDQSMVYIGSVNLDPRSETTNTELGLFARCPELAKEVIRVININKLQSSYRLRFAPDGQSLEWLATDDQGEVVLSAEPEVTPRMRLQNMLLAPFAPEQLL
jgi:putative cardiolipin synthase